jgi:hypothetical protein
MYDWYGGVQHVLCCGFCFVCLRLVYRMLSVSLDCSFLIAPSVSLTFIIGSSFIYYIFYETSIPNAPITSTCRYSVVGEYRVSQKVFSYIVTRILIYSLRSMYSKLSGNSFGISNKIIT